MRVDFPRILRYPLLLTILLGTAITACGQGTVTFNGQPLWSGTSYSELGMQFQVVIPQGATHDDMVIVPPNWANNIPQDDTPFMGWFRQNNPYNYVSLSLTGGSLFGLTSVQLADPNAPSLSPVSISFIGYLAGGSTVTNTFTTSGNGATTFATYTFNNDFASGLTSVDIVAPRWAMDNLVYAIPEPSTFALIGLGTLVIATRRLRCSPFVRPMEAVFRLRF